MCVRVCACLCVSDLMYMPQFNHLSENKLLFQLRNRTPVHADRLNPFVEENTVLWVGLWPNVSLRSCCKVSLRCQAFKQPSYTLITPPSAEAMLL